MNEKPAHDSAALAPSGAHPLVRLRGVSKRYGTVTAVKHPRAGMILVQGVVASPFRSAVEFFVVKLPAAGYLNTTGDAEMDEAESFFQGSGVPGKWKVNGILGCPEAVRLALIVTA